MDLLVYQFHMLNENNSINYACGLQIQMQNEPTAGQTSLHNKVGALVSVH